MDKRLLNYKNMFDYRLVIDKRRQKTLQIRIVDGLITVFAPRDIKKQDVLNCLEKNELWLRTQAKKLQENTEKGIKYLGKSYKLNINHSKLLKRATVELLEDEFLVSCPITTTEEEIKIALDRWKTNKLRQILEERIEYFTTNYHFNFDREKNTVRLKNQTTLWGSCSHCNNLNFNKKVIEKSMEIIDYLVVHELSHTLHKNHSQDFWNCVASIIPNHRELRSKLNAR